MYERENGLLPLAISLLSHIPHVWFHFPRTPDAKYLFGALKNNERQSKGCRRNLWERMCFPCKFQHPLHQETERVFLVCPVEGQPFPHTWSQGCSNEPLLGWLLEIPSSQSSQWLFWDKRRAMRAPHHGWRNQNPNIQIRHREKSLPVHWVSRAAEASTFPPLTCISIGVGVGVVGGSNCKVEAGTSPLPSLLPPR